jgi:hypothetical protein
LRGSIPGPLFLFFKQIQAMQIIPEIQDIYCPISPYMLQKKKLNITTQISFLLSEIDQCKLYWLLYEKTSQKQLESLKMAGTIESIGSFARIEGINLKNWKVKSIAFVPNYALESIMKDFRNEYFNAVREKVIKASSEEDC